MSWDKVLGWSIILIFGLSVVLLLEAVIIGAVWLLRYVPL